jgi:hypothetical protein
MGHFEKMARHPEADSSAEGSLLGFSFPSSSPRVNHNYL